MPGADVRSLGQCICPFFKKSLVSLHAVLPNRVYRESIGAEIFSTVKPIYKTEVDFPVVVEVEIVMTALWDDMVGLGVNDLCLAGGR